MTLVIHKPLSKKLLKDCDINVVSVFPTKYKVKEKWRKDAVIKISTLVETKRLSKVCSENKEKLIQVSIKQGTWESCCSFPKNKKGQRSAIDYIKKELYI